MILDRFVCSKAYEASTTYLFVDAAEEVPNKSTWHRFWCDFYTSPYEFIEMPSTLKWFNDPLAYFEAVDELRPTVVTDEASLATCTSIRGWCDWCKRAATFIVPSGAMFGSRTNMREGMRCTHCKLTNRQRLITCAIRECVQTTKTRIALLEQTTRLYRSLKHQYPNTSGSEFLGPNRIAGKAYVWSHR